jgi:hypothetical protein
MGRKVAQVVDFEFSMQAAAKIATTCRLGIEGGTVHFQVYTS